MVLGCLGDIVFEVSDETIRTLTNFKWQGSTKYQTHTRHGTDSLTEFVSIEPDKISFDITISSLLGVNPQKEIEDIFKYERQHLSLPLVLGEKSYGKYRWVIQSHTVKQEHSDGHGNCIHAVVSLSLLEYLRR